MTCGTFAAAPAGTADNARLTGASTPAAAADVRLETAPALAGPVSAMTGRAMAPTAAAAESCGPRAGATPAGGLDTVGVFASARAEDFAGAATGAFGSIRNGAFAGTEGFTAACAGDFVPAPTDTVTRDSGSARVGVFAGTDTDTGGFDVVCAGALASAFAGDFEGVSAESFVGDFEGDSTESLVGDFEGDSRVLSIPTRTTTRTQKTSAKTSTNPICRSSRSPT